MPSTLPGQSLYLRFFRRCPLGGLVSGSSVVSQGPKGAPVALPIVKMQLCKLAAILWVEPGCVSRCVARGCALGNFGKNTKSNVYIYIYVLYIYCLKCFTFWARTPQAWLLCDKTNPNLDFPASCQPCPLLDPLSSQCAILVARAAYRWVVLKVSEGESRYPKLCKTRSWVGRDNYFNSLAAFKL